MQWEVRQQDGNREGLFVCHGRGWWRVVMPVRSERVSGARVFYTIFAAERAVHSRSRTNRERARDGAEKRMQVAHVVARACVFLCAACAWNTALRQERLPDAK
jgi:hypothetical protein